MTMRPNVPSELRTLLDQERVIPPLSAAQRARAMARARAALSAPVTVTSAPFVAASRPWAVAMAAGLIVSGAVAAAAYEIHARFSPGPMTHPAVVSVSRVAASAPSPSAPSATAPDLPPAPAANVAASGPSAADSAREELHLMRQARAAVARGDFAAALSAIAEHARIFKSGRLVEEREALRVKALMGLGRAQEARHAAAAFRERFPRSVLSPTVGQMPVPRP